MKRIAIALTAFCGLCVCLSSCQDMAIQNYNRGIEAIENGDTAAAVEYFEKSVELRGDDPDAHFNLGVALYQVGDYDRALEELRFAEQYYPDDPALHFNLGQVYNAMGHYQSAKTEYEYSLKLDPELVEAYSAMGKLLMDTDQYAAAESYLHEALVLRPSDSETQFHMGWLYTKTGKYHEASHYFFRGLKEDPKNRYGRLGLAMSYFKREDYDLALEEYQKIYGRNRSDADALLGIGQCLLQLGRASESETFLQRSIEIRPDNPLAYKTLGDFYLQEKNYLTAIANYRMAIVQKEDFAGAHLGLGRALEAVGELTEAEESLQQALYHDPDNAAVLYRLGQLYLLKGDASRALAYYETAMEKVSGDVELEHAIRNAIAEISESD